MINGSSFAPPLVKNRLRTECLVDRTKDGAADIDPEILLKKRGETMSFRSRKGKGPGRSLIFS